MPFGIEAARALLSRSNALGAILQRTARELLGIPQPSGEVRAFRNVPPSRWSTLGRGTVGTPSPSGMPSQRGGAPESIQVGGPSDQQRLRTAGGITAEILTPQSSNVYSFAYDRDTSTLYVSFKANEHEPGSRGQSLSGGGRLGHQQIYGGRRGKKTDRKGLTYAYYNVPVRVFIGMQLAASKGTFVWDALRVRGTIYGHKYAYRLVAAMPDAKGDTYIPRRATQGGFRTRALADPGLGARGFRTSTLPQEKFKAGSVRFQEH